LSEPRSKAVFTELMMGFPYENPPQSRRTVKTR